MDQPSELIESIKKKYLSLGGEIFESQSLSSIQIFQNRALLQTVAVNPSHASTTVTMSARLVIDAMGNASPIAKQIRGPVEPDGICIVVGSCARGFDQNNNTYSDIIYTDSPITGNYNYNTNCWHMVLP